MNLIEVLLTTPNPDRARAKISDFGLARTGFEGMLHGTFCGTPHYFAPEMITSHQHGSKKGEYGKEVDAWAAGVILYILLSGIPPYIFISFYKFTNLTISNMNLNLCMQVINYLILLQDFLMMGYTRKSRAALMISQTQNGLEFLRTQNNLLPSIYIKYIIS